VRVTAERRKPLQLNTGKHLDVPRLPSSARLLLILTSSSAAVAAAGVSLDSRRSSSHAITTDYNCTNDRLTTDLIQLLSARLETGDARYEQLPDGNLP